MKYKIKITILIFLLFLPLLANAAGTVVEPTGTTTAQPVSGKDPTGVSRALNVDSAGNIGTNNASAYTTVTSGILTISASGATDRNRMTTITAHSCTFQAMSNNVGNVYVGGSTVTNASGVNPGIELVPGASFSNVGLTNANLIYVAGDNVNDEIAYVCN